MSRYTYAGPFKNPTEGFFVKQQGQRFYVFIREDRRADGSCPADRKHNASWNKRGFEEACEAEETIEQLRESFEEDYDDYLNENHDDIVRMEQYENFRNEY